jgi:hypothetical protein
MRYGHEKEIGRKDVCKYLCSQQKIKKIQSLRHSCVRFARLPLDSGELISLMSQEAEHEACYRVPWPFAANLLTEAFVAL